MAPSSKIFREATNSPTQISHATKEMFHSHSFPPVLKKSSGASAPKYVSLRDMMAFSGPPTYGRSLTLSCPKMENHQNERLLVCQNPVKRSSSEKFLLVAFWEKFIQQLKRPLANWLSLLNEKVISKISRGIGNLFAGIP